MSMRTPTYVLRGVMTLLVLSGFPQLISMPGNLAYGHTFTTSESAHFLSLVDQIRAETALVTMNLDNNNATLAQTHAEKAARILNNSPINNSTVLDEISERNVRIGDGLETGLAHIEENVTLLATEQQAQQLPQDRIKTINQEVVSLNDLLSEAISVRVESEHQKNATTWATILADLTNVVLSHYGNATGVPFDLVNMSNLPSMEMDHVDNMTMTMTMSDSQHMQMTENIVDDNNSAMITMMSNSTSPEGNTNTTIIVVDKAAYQSAQYVSNTTMLELFYEILEPLTITTVNETSTGNNATTTVMMEEGQGGVASDNNNVKSSIDELEVKLLQLRDEINDKATPHDVMITAHLGIHPLLIQIYELTVED